MVIQAREGCEIKGWEVFSGKICMNLKLKGSSEIAALCSNNASTLLGIIREDTSIEIFDLELGQPNLKPIVTSFQLYFYQKVVYSQHNRILFSGLSEAVTYGGDHVLRI